MSGETSECDNCGETTENEPIRLCDECNEADGLTAQRDARAAGYGEEVADVVAWLESRADEQAKHGTASPRSLFAGLLYSITQDIRVGAHIGAAKKVGA